MKVFYRNFKRIFDFFASLLAVIILFPLMIIISIIIKLDSKGPLIFKQKRLGIHGKIFEMYKFRSMKVNAEKEGVYHRPDDPRITKVGEVIRKLSLDELPQFFNVLKGDMSLIGPRPPLTYHPWSYDEYTLEQKQMFLLRPGITGWAQVHGRKNVEWNERIKLNIYYVNNQSFLLDFKIFCLTLCRIVQCSDNHNTMETVYKEYARNKQDIKGVSES